MDTAYVKVIVGCLLIICKTGLAQNQNQKFCRRTQYGIANHFVDVCQNDSASSRKAGDIIILDAAGAYLQQNIECKCNIKVVLDHLQDYIQVNLFIHSDNIQNATFEIDSQPYIDGKKSVNITSKAAITFRQGFQNHHTKLCMGISKTHKGNLIVQCEANRHERQTAPTTRKQVTTQTDKEDTTDTIAVILCTSIGVVLLIVIIVVCCVRKRKRGLAKDVSNDSEPKDSRSQEQTNRSAIETAAASQRTGDTHETGSEYAYVDQCAVTASETLNSTTNPTESDVYNHLNEVKPVQHSDNVYSTTQKSSAMSKHDPMNKTTEGDVYNHLNEVQSISHSDNIYNATHVHNADMQNSGDTSSQYDSVELVKRKHNPQPESDYNVLSFP